MIKDKRSRSKIKLVTITRKATYNIVKFIFDGLGLSIDALNKAVEIMRN